MTEPRTLAKLRGAFDAVEVLSGHQLARRSYEFLLQTEPDRTYCLWWRRRPGLGVGYVLMPVSDRALLEDEGVAAAIAQQAEEVYRQRVVLRSATRSAADGPGPE